MSFDPKKAEDTVVSAYKAVENGAVHGYQATENFFVRTAKKIGDTCIRHLFCRPGETVEEARARLQRGK